MTVPLAPRYDPRILEALRVLDDRRVPIAETCRRVGTAAERLGLTRPSYVHLRRILLAIRDEEDAARERRQAIREVLRDGATHLLTGGSVAYIIDLDDDLAAIERGELGRRRRRKRT